MKSDANLISDVQIFCYICFFVFVQNVIRHWLNKPNNNFSGFSEPLFLHWKRRKKVNELRSKLERDPTCQSVGIWNEIGLRNKFSGQLDPFIITQFPKTHPFVWSIWFNLYVNRCYQSHKEVNSEFAKLGTCKNSIWPATNWTWPTGKILN